MNLQLSIIMFIYASEMAVITTMICARLERRRDFFSGACKCAALTLIYTVILAFYQPSILVIHIPIVLVSFLYVYWCYVTNILQVLYIVSAGYIIQRISSLLNTLISYFSPHYLAHDVNGQVSALWYVLIFVCDAVVFWGFHCLGGRGFGIPQLRKNATIRVVAFGILVVLMNQPWTLGMLHDDIMHHSYTRYALAEVIWNFIACVLCVFVQFDITHIDRRDNELEIAQKLISDKERQYKMSKSNVDAINRKCHDLKYQLSALSKGEDNQKHISEAMELVESFDSAIHTGNDTLDIIFTEKNSYCKKHDIDFVCMVDGDKLSFIDVTDLYVMFGNIIDNAINAVRILEDHSKRSIYIRIHQENQLLLIQTENAFKGSLQFKDGLPKTTTGDEFNHGYGVSSIKMIAEKYGGSLNTRAEDNVFYLNILIPMEGKEERQ